MRVLVVVALVLAPLLSSGCAALVLIPRAIDQMSEGPAGPVGFEFHRSDGATESGSPFRIRHFLDPDARHRYVVALIDGKVFSSRRDDVAGDMDAARLAYPGADGKSEDEVSRRFGAPYKESRFEDVRVLWYLRPKERGEDDVFALVFRQGRFVTGFRTNRTEMERILEKPSPFAAAGAATAIRRPTRSAR